MSENALLVEFLRLHQQMSLQAGILHMRITAKFGVRPDAVREQQVAALSVILDRLRTINQDLTMLEDHHAATQ